MAENRIPDDEPEDEDMEFPDQEKEEMKNTLINARKSMENHKMMTEINVESIKVNAKLMWETYTAYLECGFTKEQALSLTEVIGILA